MSKTKVDYDKLRELLLERRGRILDQLHRAKESDYFNTQDIPMDSVEEAWDRYDLDMLANISDAWSRELAEIDTALVNIDKHDYGACTYCSKPIAPQRLQAIPSASLCIECQEQYDEAQLNSKKTDNLEFGVTEAGLAAAFGV